MVSERTKSFPADRCKQMGSPEEFPKVVASLEQMESANKPLTAEKLALLHGTDAAWAGGKDAKVTVVEFSDFECPYCVRAATAVTDLKKKYGDKIRVIFRHFPLSFHKNAHVASQAAMFANSKGKFWEFHDMVFQNQKAMTRPDLEKYAQKIGLNVGALKKALDSGAFKSAVDADMELGKQVGVQGTPTMFVNGGRVQNPTDVNAISKDIDAALAK
jgi:protein-disulfide isomerase